MAQLPAGMSPGDPPTMSERLAEADAAAVRARTGDPPAQDPVVHTSRESPSTLTDREAMDARATLILRWARAMALILVVVPLGVLSCVEMSIAGLPEDRGQGGLHMSSEGRTEILAMLTVPVGLIVAALAAVIAGGGRGWLAVTVDAVAGLAIVALGVWGLLGEPGLFLMYFVAVAAVGAALIVGAWLRLGSLTRARNAAHS